MRVCLHLTIDEFQETLNKPINQLQRGDYVLDKQNGRWFGHEVLNTCGGYNRDEPVLGPAMAVVIES